MVLKLDRPVLLVGLPGAGKTRTGQMLAARIGCAFVDSDEAVEREAGLSIPQIFESEGEAGFRARERRIVLALLQSGSCVIALGGGGFSDPDVRAAARARGIVFWLDAPEDVIAARIAAGGVRPLFDGRDVATTLRGLAASRAVHYAEAHHRVTATTSEEMTAEVLAILDQIAAAAASARR